MASQIHRDLQGKGYQVHGQVEIGTEGFSKLWNELEKKVTNKEIHKFAAIPEMDGTELSSDYTTYTFYVKRAPIIKDPGEL